MQKYAKKFLIARGKRRSHPLDDLLEWGEKGWDDRYAEWTPPELVSMCSSLLTVS